MSANVFGALLRAAGPLAPARAAEPADPFESGVELPAPDVASAPARAAPAQPAPSPPETGAPAVVPHADDGRASEPAAGIGGAPAPAAAAPPARLTPPPAAADAAVHPAVQAALRWVRADPAVVESSVVDAAQPPSRPALAGSAPTPPVRQRPRPGEDQPPPAVADRLAAAAASAPAPAAPVFRYVERDARIAAADPPRPADVSALAPAHPGVEVSIGSIHVTIDAAPAPLRGSPAVATMAATPQRAPAPARPSARSGFARHRLPRF